MLDNVTTHRHDAPARDWIDLGGVLAAAGRGWWLAAILGIVSAAGFGIRAKLATPIYRSEALVMIADEAGQGIGGLVGGGLGSIAQLAGVDLGGTQERRAEYLARLTSRGLIRDFIVREDLVKVLFADRWDEEKGVWRESFWYDVPPPLEDAVEKFRDDVLRVIQDRDTGIITVQVEWPDPKLAAEWVTKLIAQVNEQARQAAIAEAESSIAFLNDSLAENPALQVREGIYRLIEAHLGRVVVASSQRQYALKVIDPPTTSDERRYVRPRLALETVLGGLLGAVLGVLVSLWMHRRTWWPGPQ